MHGLLKLQATVQGREGTFLFDSGSGVSSISPEFAAEIGCHPWGQLTGFRMTGDRLDMQHCDGVLVSLGGRTILAPTLGVFDVSKYLPPGVEHIDGTIALDLFENDSIEFSYGGRFLRILDSQSLAEKSRGLRAIPIHIVRDSEGLSLTVNLPVRTVAGTAWFEMDSGNTSTTVLVNKAIASELRVRAEEEAEAIDISLLDGTRFNGPVRVLELILDGNLGVTFLSTHDVVIDLPRKTAWITPVASHP